MRLRREEEGEGCLVEGEGGREDEVVWGIKDARRQKGGARGGLFGGVLRGTS